MQKTCSTDCMSCDYGKQLKKRCLEECESAIDAVYDFHALTTICKNQHIKNKEVKETMKEDVPTATLQEKNDAIVQAINQIIVNVKNAAMKGSTPRFGGYVLNDGGTEYIYIKQVIYNDPATIVLWSDGTKTTSKCDYRDKYNPEMGLILAVMKKIIDGKYVADLLHDWAPEEGQKRVTLADVRKKYR